MEEKPICSLLYFYKGTMVSFFSFSNKEEAMQVRNIVNKVALEGAKDFSVSNKKLLSQLNDRLKIIETRANHGVFTEELFKQIWPDKDERLKKLFQHSVKILTLQIREAPEVADKNMNGLQVQIYSPKLKQIFELNEI